MKLPAASSGVSSSCSPRRTSTNRFPPKTCGNDDASVGVLNPIENKGKTKHDHSTEKIRYEK